METEACWKAIGERKITSCCQKAHPLPFSVSSTKATKTNSRFSLVDVLYAIGYLELQDSSHFRIQMRLLQIYMLQVYY
jgi:hypothetical protein